MYNLETKYIFLSRDVTFDESSHQDLKNKVVVLDLFANVVSFLEDNSLKSDFSKEEIA